MSASAFKHAIDHKLMSYNATKVIRPITTYTILVTDSEVQGDTTNGAFTVTLPTIAALLAAGKSSKVYRISKEGAQANAVTIAPGSGDTINATTSLSTGTTALNYYIIEMDPRNNDWRVIATNVAPA